MKKLLFLSISILCLALSGCKSDEPEYDGSKGKLVVHLEQENQEEVDFSEYSVAIVPKRGFIASAPNKDIEWPVEVNVGTYTIAAASPLVTETETTESYYYGEVKDVKIKKDQTTEVTVSLSLKEFSK